MHNLTGRRLYQQVSKLITHSIFIFYRFIMPTATGFLLFVLPQITSRSAFLGYQITDFLVRLMLWLMFCIAYWSLSNIYRPNPKRPSWLLLNKDISALLHLLFSAIGSGLILSLVTWWSVDSFVPILSRYSIFLGIGNGFSYAIFVLGQYLMLPSKLTSP
jgi:hypothetical protein